MVTVNTQRPALEEVASPDDTEPIRLIPGQSYELAIDVGVSPIYFLGASEPKGPYCNLKIWIAGFGLVAPNKESSPYAPYDACYPVLFVPPTAEEKAEAERNNQPIVVVEGLRVVSTNLGAIRFEKNGARTSYIPL